MHRFTLHNDEIHEAGDRVLSPGQVGLMNGWGVFSTLRVYDGVPFAWERHRERMQRDAARMRVPFPRDPAWLEARLSRLVEANQARNATLRVAVVRNGGGLFESPVGREFDVIAFTADLNRWSEAVCLGVAPDARHAACEFSGAKILSWAQNLTWYERAHEQGWDDMLLLNERGEVAECTSANIFVVQGSSVSTPPRASGCLAGVTRSVLLEEIRVRGLNLLEEIVLLADLETADEVFVTSTTRELLPVRAIAGLKLKAHPHPVRDRLQQAFGEYVQDYISSRRGVEIVK